MPPTRATPWSGKRGEHRACADPHAKRFLRDAANLPLKSRILLTSRLFPRELDDLAGCQRHDLATLDPEDAVDFFQAHGIRGTRAEFQAACAPYGYHALALRLLIGVILRDKHTPGDIKVVRGYQVLPKLKGKEQHHILQVAYEALDKPKRALLSRIAAFRFPMTYNALAIFNKFGDEQHFDAALDELEERGLLSFDREQRHYDMHPVVRGYAYDSLRGKERGRAHAQLRDYFAAVQVPEKVERIEELTPVIELYHHTIQTGRFDEAWRLLQDRLDAVVSRQFTAIVPAIELFSAVFPKEEGKSPLLTSPDDRLEAIRVLSEFHCISGQPQQACELYSTHAHGNPSGQTGEHRIFRRPAGLWLSEVVGSVVCHADRPGSDRRSAKLAGDQVMGGGAACGTPARDASSRRAGTGHAVTTLPRGHDAQTKIQGHLPAISS